MSHRTSSYQDVVSLPTALASRRDLIDTMRVARFVTIEGPIGAGKSVLAREFLRSCSADTRTALIHGGAHPLTRDELWHQAIEALSATRGGPQTVQHRASRRDATSALHEIAHIDDPAVLVFDGIEVCGSPAVHNDLIWLLERNSRLTVVTAARRRTHDPVLTAIAGSVRISADDLKLSGAQSTELLHELGGNSDTTLPPMYAGDVIATHWAIDRGLRELTPDALTAVQLDAALARLGERQRQDVLALSIPADANRELLETICFDVDSMLINAEEAGVLEWTARGGESHWSMPAHLRRVAIRRLAQLNPAGARSKQSLVAHFHYEHGDVLRAWEHAVLARDFDLMTTLLDHHSDALNRGQHDVVISGLESLGATTLVEHPALKLGLAQAYRFAGLHARADSLFARGARRINKKNERLGFAKQLADLGRLSHVYQLSGDFKRAAHTADRIISMISVREDHTLVEAGPGAHAALARAAGSMLATGRYRDAGELAARLSAVAAENGELLYGAIAVQAVVASIDGRISEARRFVGLLDDMHVQDSVRLGLRGFAGEIARALIALDSRDEASARETIDGVAAIIDATPHWPAVSVLHALCALAQDRPDEGLTVMARSASAGSSRAISPAAESYLGFVRALLHLAQGSSAKAAAEIQRAKLHDTGLEALTRLLDNDAADALAIATRVLERRDASERDRLLALSVAGGSAHQMDLEIVAEGFAAEAAECSSAWGLAAPLRWLPADLAEWLASRLASPMQQSRASLFRRGENVHVDLTEREVAVLQAAMHFTTRREIAESLEVSENTVKTQLRTANEKLGTSSRAGAVARAAELGYFLP